MVGKKITYGTIGLIIGVILSIAVGFVISIAILMISIFSASLAATIGSKKDSAANKPNANAAILFGFLAGVVALVASYYIIPVNRSVNFMYVQGEVTVTAAQVMPLSLYFLQMLIPFILEVIVISSIGFVIGKRIGNQKTIEKA